MKKLILVLPAVLLIATAAHAQKFTTWTTARPGDRTTTTTTTTWSAQETTVVPAKVVPTESAGAQVTTTRTETYFSYAQGDLFRPNEFSLDAFAAYETTPRNHFGDLFTHNLRNGTWGGGVGVNYFITKCFGIGADTIMAANGGQFVDSASANLIFRIPFDAAHVAPYFFGGGGGQFDPSRQWLADVGAGVEFRWNEHGGIFTDARFIWPQDIPNYGLFRAGLRFAF